jgi:hypothetical protein
MARSERTMSNTSAMGMEGISEPDVAALVSEMRNLERRLSTGIRPAVRLSCPLDSYHPLPLAPCFAPASTKTALWSFQVCEV